MFCLKRAEETLVPSFPELFTKNGGAAGTGLSKNACDKCACLRAADPDGVGVTTNTKVANIDIVIFYGDILAGLSS